MNILLSKKTELVKKIKTLPSSTGIYFYIDKNKEIIYIGKAINIRKRIKSYFYEKNASSDRAIKLLKKICDLDWIVTLSESDALILEDQMIKRHKPKYNILLKDDKSYPYIKITSKELFPRMMLTREIQKEQAHYFGPYTCAKEAKLTIETLRQQFPLRTSKMNLDGTKIYRPCLNFQMKKCLAPCNGEVDSTKYRKMVLQIIRILKGNTSELLRELQEEMNQKAINQEFEKAAILRNKIFAVKKTIKRHYIISKDKTHKDIIVIFRQGTEAGIQVLFIRSGILFGSDFFFIPNAKIYSYEELLRTIFSKLYLGKAAIAPEEIILSAPYFKKINTPIALEEYFLKNNHKVKIIIPQKGERKQLVKMALKNAEKNFYLHFNQELANKNLLDKIQKTLRLNSTPRRIECFDISNIQGKNVVASMVVMQDNQFAKKDYRKFKIKTSTNDDIASMREVLSRRWKQWQENKNTLPNLTIIDGGKGQLKAIYQLALEMGVPLAKMDLLAIAKGKSAKKKISQQFGRKLDFDYLLKPNCKDPLLLQNQPSILRPLQKIRDEAHRVALNFHRKLREKESLSSPLQAIDKIGEVKRKNLLFAFKNIENIRRCSVQELQKTPLISRQDAENIYNHLNKT